MPARRTESDVEQVGNWHSRKANRGTKAAKTGATRPAGKSRKSPIRGQAEGKQGGGIQSLARAFSILEVVAHEREGMGLADISRRVRLHNSTTFHLVKTLTTLGYLRQIKETKRYRIGRPLFALAAGALDEIEMVSLANPVLQDLARESGESCYFAVRMGYSVVVIARTPGPGAFQLTDRIGVVRPAHCTALGKVLLAALPLDQLEIFLHEAELPAMTPKTIVDKKALRRELEEVRRARLAYDDGEFDAEVRCIAVPVRDFTGAVVGAIGLSGPIWRLSMQALQARARIVQAAAERLSADYGRPIKHGTGERA